MLIEFRVKNYRSFRDEETLSLVASSDDSLPGNRVACGSDQLLRAAVIFGANASGKSNLVRAVGTMVRMVSASAGQQDRGQLPFDPFRLQDTRRGQPTTFEAVFIHDGTRYQYGFSYTNERIVEEWLFAAPRVRMSRWFERTYDPKTDGYDWAFGTQLTGEKLKLARLTRPDALFLSVAAGLNNKKLGRVQEWFRNYLRVLPIEGPPDAFWQMTARRFSKGLEERAADALSKMVRRADLGIGDVRIVERPVSEEDLNLPSDMPEETKKQILDSPPFNSPFFDVRFLHGSARGNENAWLPIQEESMGTRRFFSLLGPWTETLVGGFSVFVDELSANMHPLLVQELLKWMQNPKANSGGGQIVFTTHSTTLMKRDLFRRDQIWFVEKDREGASHLYSLYDFKKKPRKDEAFEKGYLSGRYGAVPILEEFGEE